MSGISTLIAICHTNTTRITELASQIDLLQKQLATEITAMNDRLTTVVDAVNVINSKAEAEKKEIEELMAANSVAVGKRSTVGRLVL